LVEVLAGLDAEPFVLEAAAQHLAHIQIVVDDEDPTEWSSGRHETS
jgi:hypothetical protein